MKVIVERTFNDKEESECNNVIVEDKDGNQYDIQIDKFGGIEITSNDGCLLIEPHCGNNITLKAINMARQEERNNARIEERAKAIKSFCKIKCGESKECNQYCYDCIEFIKLINE